MAIDRSSSIGIIGAGRVAGALADALLKCGRPLDGVASRTLERAEALAKYLPFVRATTIEELVATNDLVFLAVPDDAIEGLSSGLAWRSGQAVVHLSGGRGLEVLAMATAAGAVAGCLHPLQTFPGGEEPARARARFNGIACGVEAAAPLDALLEAIVDDLGGHSFRLEGVDRAAYHAAAVFVSNDVVAAMGAATRAWALAGLAEADARAALSPLLQATAAAIAGRTLPEALTGPVARGDVETVRRHLQSLAGDPALHGLYRRLGAELLRLELGHSPETASALSELFNEAGA
ncbi:MAG: DUF2520 domain-containing protein [Chloroflexi bacterium]|nr:DUF2520 domain-containing protein [Chloroflexota bacterium]MDA1147303.1 DUF2520 domain-containing protein [Chloroflexota bacterium]MQC82472.1 DUF2520 domain-containing protein [Chloroflexota bacterium]